VGPLGWNRDVTVVAGNQICNVKTEIRGEEGRNRMRGIVVTTSRNGNLVEYSMMAMIRLGQVRGWLQLYKYNGNLLQNSVLAGCELPRATHVIAGRTMMFASRKEKSAGEKIFRRGQKPHKVTIRGLLLHLPRHWHISPHSNAFRENLVTEWDPDSRRDGCDLLGELL
jgi:hypothetical protein